MEYDMACPKCEHPLKVEGTNKLVCSANCGYEREFIKPVLSQGDLLKENKELKELIAKFSETELTRVEIDHCLRALRAYYDKEDDSEWCVCCEEIERKFQQRNLKPF